MKALVFLEQHDNALQRGSLGVLAKAAALGADEVGAALIGGPDVTALVAEAGRSGAAKVHVAAADSLALPLAQPRVDVLADIVRSGGYDTVLFSNTVLAGDVAAGLAARLEAGLNWDLVDLAVRDGALVGSRLAFGDSVLVDVGWRSEHRLAVFRGGSFDPDPTLGGEPETVDAPVALQEHSSIAQIVEQQFQADDGPSLADADVVVAGGMGLGAAEKFAVAEELAQVLGGVVGATRAAVYAGWYPHAAQIGQTGKTIAPRLYVGLGISGAIQHKVGMQGSKVIIAINKDPNAPIFEFSDLAVVGDLHEVVPQLIELIRARKSS
jgi:electron transfer flavoprotein alpha subunit